MSNAAPYANLSPDAVIDAVESTGILTDGRLLALNSFENRVYQVGVEDASPIVAKFYRAGRWSDAAILEEHAFAAELASAELPVVAPIKVENSTLQHHGGFRFALYPRQGGRAPELESSDNLAWLGRLLARIHGIGSRDRFHARGAVDRATFIEAPSKVVLASAMLPDTVRDRYSRVVAQLDNLIAQIWATVDPLPTLRLHGDCHIGNVLWTDSGPHFVDLDDARMGPAVQDLWMLATNARAMDALLEGYEEFRDFDRRQLTLIEPLRLMRQIHYAGWIAQRWDDPAFPRAFPFASEPRWWEQHVHDLQEAVSTLEESA
ncbi:MAG TPA: serine/threonine protein kinase [Rudaea sp.]|jgi:Ser/Thr protein kinase RdoA (MazF antagonist)|nr:serine/threonine protein kinase [Rudaea sp.]